jgi:hypothetical protein
VQSVQVKIDHPERLSRGILLLKTFFGWIYVGIPHGVCLMALSIASGFLTFLAWFAVLFTGKYPKSFFDFNVGVYNWSLRVAAYLGLLRDEYPPFSFDVAYPANVAVVYPEKSSRGLLFLRLFFAGIYVGIPHGVCLYIRMIGHGVVAFIAWWAILFTGKMPESMFRFMSGTYRWLINIQAYQSFLTDEYPPFTGKSDSGAAAAPTVSA